MTNAIMYYTRLHRDWEFQDMSMNNPMNAPFEIKPSESSRTGALLLHGLYDSCFILKDIANTLAQNNIWTKSILLAGHGTRPEDLLTVRWETWYEQLVVAVREFRKQVDELILLGFSTGGALAIHHALQKADPKIKALVLFAPAIQIRSPFIALSGYLPKLQWLSSQFLWLRHVKEHDETKYTSMTCNSAYQVYRLTCVNQQLLQQQKLSIPQWIVSTEDDEVISHHSILQYHLQQPNPKNRLVVYSQQPHSFSDSRILPVSSVYPLRHIDSFSHICLAVHPDNTHYGEQGDWLTYLRQNPHLTKPIVYGAVPWFKNREKNRLRLTFNPHFETLMQNLIDWLAKHSDSLVNR